MKARGVRAWSYDELVKASDVVLVIEPLKTENNDDTFATEYDLDWDFQGVSTTFKVHCCFKGSTVPDEIVVKHFEYKPNGMGGANGPTFLQFLPGTLKYKAAYSKDDKEVSSNTYYEPHPCWLAFLKKTADGSFVPVAGQIDTGLSFKELHDAF